VIEVSGVTKNFGRFTAVRDLSFRVDKGEILGFLGPNGAGKTTTMRIVTGFIPPSAGTAVVSGFNVLDNPLEAKKKIGYLPEIPPLYPELSVRDYLEFVARIKGVGSRRRKTCIERAIERTSLGEVKEKLTGRLSKGFRQRVGLAQALVHEPEVLILDEPTAGLDPQQINETRTLIRELAGDHTIILSTHILPEVAMTCERVAIINNGRLVAEGTAESLTERYREGTSLEATVLGAEPEVRSTIASIPGVVDIDSRVQRDGSVAYRITVAGDHDVRRQVASSLVEAGHGLLELRQAGLSLEEVYLRVISSEEPVS
jgi:ABC-2 type transport system ATP-binding protein